jgi:hypothetical protein
MSKLPPLLMNSKRVSEALKVTNAAAEKINITATSQMALTFCFSGRGRHVPPAEPPLAA